MLRCCIVTHPITTSLSNKTMDCLQLREAQRLSAHLCRSNPSPLSRRSCLLVNLYAGYSRDLLFHSIVCLDDYVGIFRENLSPCFCLSSTTQYFLLTLHRVLVSHSFDLPFVKCQTTITVFVHLVQTSLSFSLNYLIIFW